MAEGLLAVSEDGMLVGANAAALEMLASSVPLVDIMSEFIARFEQIFPGAIGSVLLMDEEERHLLHGAAPSLPVEYNQAIHGAPIGPRAGSCGTAAFLGEEVVVSDITSDPLCLKLIRGLRKPIVSTSANISGEKSPASFQEVAQQIKTGVDLIIEERTTEQMNQASQIIKIGLNGQVEVIRK